MGILPIFLASLMLSLRAQCEWDLTVVRVTLSTILVPARSKQDLKSFMDKWHNSSSVPQEIQCAMTSYNKQKTVVNFIDLFASTNKWFLFLYWDSPRILVGWVCLCLFTIGRVWCITKTDKAFPCKISLLLDKFVHWIAILEISC